MLAFILSFIVLAVCIVLARATRALPHAELRRQARSSSDKKTARVYQLASFGKSLDILLETTGFVSFVILLLSAQAIGPWLLASVILVFGATWLFLPPAKPGGFSWIVVSPLVRPVAGLLSMLEPLLKNIARLKKSKISTGATGIYDKEDLIELLARQAKQPENRILQSDLNIAGQALAFGDQLVATAMTPRKRLKLVSYDDSIGPHLMDELYSSGQGLFLVVKGSLKNSSPNIVGTLSLGDIIGLTKSASVSDFASDKVYFVNEQQTLTDALTVFVKTGQQLLAVVNNFEETVGALSLAQTIEQIFGKLPDDEFEHHGKRHIVAGRSTEK